MRNVRCNRLYSDFNLEFIGDLGDREGKGRERGFHASGHIHRPGLVELLETIRHSEDRGFFQRHFTGKVELILPKPGNLVELPSR